MSILEVVLEQRFVDQQIINRFNYVSSGTPAAVTESFALISALGAIYDPDAVPPAYPPDGLMRSIASIQGTGVEFVQITARVLYSDLDFYDMPFIQPLTGTQTGDTLPPTSAMGFYSSRIRQSVRRGQKRYVGLVETHQNAGVYTGAFLGSLRNTAAAMGAIRTYVDEGNPITFTPAICSKEKYVPDPEKPDRYAYRYYATEAEQLAHTAVGVTWDVHNRVRTQNSRQYGKGR